MLPKQLTWVTGAFGCRNVNDVRFGTPEKQYVDNPLILFVDKLVNVDKLEHPQKHEVLVFLKYIGVVILVNELQCINTPLPQTDNLLLFVKSILDNLIQS